MRTSNILMIIALCCLQAASGLIIESGAQYLVKLKSRPPACNVKDESLGFLNKTCNAGTLKPYGQTTGPVLRDSSNGNNWKEWTLTVLDETPAADGSVTVSFANFYTPSPGVPKCLGDMVPEKKKACTSENLADRVHIHPKQSAPWKLVPVTGEKDTFNIIAADRGATCLRFLGAPAQCNDAYVRLYAADAGSGLQRWVITPVKVPTPSPSPVPTPSPSPSPSPEASPTPTPTPNPIPVPQPSPPPPVDPSTVPGRPTSVSASAAGSTRASITWNAPASNGGSPILRYAISCVSQPGGVAVGPQTFPASSACSGNSCSSGVGGFISLQPSTTYTCQIVAVNSIGFSARSASSNDFTTGSDGTPGAPTSVTGTASTTDGTAATVTWTAPSFIGSSAIIGYDVLCSGGGSAVATTISAGTACVQNSCSSGITGLSPGTEYTCTVTAANLAGNGDPSEPCIPFTTIITPPGPFAPDPVTNIVLTPGTASEAEWSLGTVTWTIPASDGGSPILGYDVTCTPTNASPVMGPVSYPGATTATTGTLAFPVTPATTYNCEVAARNAVGITPASSLNPATTAPYNAFVTENSYTYSVDQVVGCSFSGDNGMTNCNPYRPITSVSTFDEPSGVLVRGTTIFIDSVYSPGCGTTFDCVMACTLNGPVIDVNDCVWTGKDFDEPYGIAIYGTTMVSMNYNSDDLSVCTMDTTTQPYTLTPNSCALSAQTSSFFGGSLWNGVFVNSGAGIFVTGQGTYNVNTGAVYYCDVATITTSATACSVATTTITYPFGLAIYNEVLAFITSEATTFPVVIPGALHACTVSGTTLTACNVIATPGINLIEPRSVTLVGNTLYIVEGDRSTVTSGAVRACPIDDPVTPTLGNCYTVKSGLAQPITVTFSA